MSALGRGLGLLLVTGLACAHSSPKPPASSREVRAAIEATNAQFAAAMMKADAAAIAALFTEDGEVIAPAAKGFITEYRRAPVTSRSR